MIEFALVFIAGIIIGMPLGAWLFGKVVASAFGKLIASVFGKLIS